MFKLFFFLSHVLEVYPMLLWFYAVSENMHRSCLLSIVLIDYIEWEGKQKAVNVKCPFYFEWFQSWTLV